MGTDMHPYTAAEKQDKMRDEIREVISSFGISEYECVRRYGNGHINDTYLLERGSCIRWPGARKSSRWNRQSVS